jgi:hypothetical protein
MPQPRHQRSCQWSLRSGSGTLSVLAAGLKPAQRAKLSAAMREYDAEWRSFPNNRLGELEVDLAIAAAEGVKSVARDGATSECSGRSSTAAITRPRRTSSVFQLRHVPVTDALAAEARCVCPQCHPQCRLPALAKLAQLAQLTTRCCVRQKCTNTTSCSSWGSRNRLSFTSTTTSSDFGPFWLRF